MNNAERELFQEALDEIRKLQAELKLAHRIIKKGTNTLEEVAYVFDIEENNDE